jgi:putative transposase
VTGRKRHLLVDTTGLILKVVVHAANLSDTKGGRLVIDSVREQFASLRKLWVDKAYQGWYWHWLKIDRDLDVAVLPKGPYKGNQAEKQEGSLRRAMSPGSKVAKRRWVVERTFAWLGRYRRFSKDYEYLPTMSEALIYAAMSHRMVRRLARAGQPAVEIGRRPRQLTLPFSSLELAA